MVRKSLIYVVSLKMVLVVVFDNIKPDLVKTVIILLKRPYVTFLICLSVLVLYQMNLRLRVLFPSTNLVMLHHVIIIVLFRFYLYFLRFLKVLFTKDYIIFLNVIIYFKIVNLQLFQKETLLLYGSP